MTCQLSLHIVDAIAVLRLMRERRCQVAQALITVGG